jgi:hypothetical protein
MPEPIIPPVKEKPMKAIRMIIAFDGEQVHLVSQQSVEMVLPPSDQIEPLQEKKGFWYDP